MTSIHASNGLRMTLPESIAVRGRPQRLDVSQTPDGFRVTLAGPAVRRVAREASVLLRDGTSPDGAWPLEREIGGRRIRFRIDRADGGSGGTQIDFRAWEACAGGHLEYTQGDVVEEPSEPDLSLVWLVIAGTEAPR